MSFHHLLMIIRVVADKDARSNLIDDTSVPHVIEPDILYPFVRILRCITASKYHELRFWITSKPLSQALRISWVTALTIHNGMLARVHNKNALDLNSNTWVG